MTNGVVHWVLAQDRHRITCMTCPTDEGGHLAIVYFDGLPVRRRHCVGGAELLDWTQRVHADWQAHGWLPADY